MASDNNFSIFISLIYIPALILAADITINELAKLQTMTIDEYINYINPPAVHKFQNGIGESVLCVKYEDQISLRSERISKGLGERSRDTFTYNSSSIEECPEGTVPILEITRERVKRAGSVRQYLNRKSSVVPDRVLGDNSNHEWAVVEIRAQQEVHEGKAAFNAWQPFVQSDDFLSNSQIWLLHEDPNGTLTESMEAGLQVYPKRHGDPLVRFFIFYARDGYANSCQDLDCKGFIQEGKYYPGMPLNGVSVYDGKQLEIRISIKRETRGNNIVWAVYLQDSLVGHWPAVIFKDLTLSANRVDFGGEVAVVSRSPGTPFSKTDMGSGRFPEGGFKKAAYVRNIQLFTAKGAPIILSKNNRFYFASKPNCYNVKGFVTNDNYWGDLIYFGGPGGDVPQCTY